MNRVFAAPCDCGGYPQHNDGGHYHARLQIFGECGDYRVIVGTSRWDFPGDHDLACERCGGYIRIGEEHFCGLSLPAALGYIRWARETAWEEVSPEAFGGMR